MVWSKAGTTTLTGTGSTVSVTVSSISKFMNFITNSISSGGTAAQDLRFGSGGSVETGSTYAARYSRNGGTDGTPTSDVTVSLYDTTSGEQFSIGNVINISDEEKLGIYSCAVAGTAGAGTAPLRQEGVFKNTLSSAQINIMDIEEVYGSGVYAADSNFTILGSEGVESMTVQDGAVYYETDTNKAYVLYNNSWTEL